MLSKLINILSFPLIVLFVFYFLIYPVFIEAVENRQTLTAEESNLESIKGQINNIEVKFLESVGYLNSEEGMEGSSFVDLALPAHPNVHDILIVLYKIRDDQSIDFLNVDSISISDAPEYEDIYSVDFNFDISGGYEQVNNFILGLQKLDRIFILKQIQFSKDTSTQVVSSGEEVDQYDNISASITGNFLYSVNNEVINGGLSLGGVSYAENTEEEDLCRIFIIFFCLMSKDEDEENKKPAKVISVTTSVSIAWNLLPDENITEYQVQYCRGVSCAFTFDDSIIVQGGSYTFQFTDPPNSNSETLYRARVRPKLGNIAYGPWTPVLDISTEE